MTALLWVQGCYFVATGVWPLVHIGSFQRITGPKHDLWLVKTVAVLVVAIGAGLVAAAIRGHADPALVVVAVASCAGLLVIDLTYVAKRVIPPVYLGDALAEMALLAAWIIALAR